MEFYAGNTLSKFSAFIYSNQLLANIKEIGCRDCLLNFHQQYGSRKTDALGFETGIKNT